ncbi:homoserine dehydrogenase [Solibacillus silvestris StLB046]|uniref:Homoserine dehydrogenase n=1 Tax=Solibacillus silvestris (strain StLB046) TaxID=1002809 RepID=F2F2P5_SOLSS|nr:hypothetical protein [Solibacillus silvestris]BAK17343.1 homoserine dehydrogenase [Solibacillus silvestris StLB046]
MLQTQAKNFAWVFDLWGKGGFIARVGWSLVEVPVGSGKRWSLLEQMWVLLEGLCMILEDWKQVLENGTDVADFD